MFLCTSANKLLKQHITSGNHVVHPDTVTSSLAPAAHDLSDHVAAARSRVLSLLLPLVVLKTALAQPDPQPRPQILRATRLHTRLISVDTHETLHAVDAVLDSPAYTMGRKHRHPKRALHPRLVCHPLIRNCTRTRTSLRQRKACPGRPRSRC